MDKKLRNAAEKITMPENMKERIIKACENIDKTNIERIDNDGYTEVASGTERISRKNNIIRIVSAVAACAVLAAGIGTTGVLLHKNHRSQLAGSEDVDVAESRSCPFGDFNTFKYSFEDGNVKYVNYYDENNGKLSDFLNNFDWGDALEHSEIEKDSRYLKFEYPDSEYVYAEKVAVLDNEDRVYTIYRNTSEGYSIIKIVNGGYVSYMDFSSHIATEGVDVITENRCYKIDFEAFDKGVQEIFAQEEEIEAEKEAEVSPFGDFTTFDFDFQNETVLVNKNSGRSYDLVADMLNRWDWGEETEAQPGREDPFALTDLEYEISWEEDHEVYWLKIAEDGYVIYTGIRYDDDYLNSEEICRKYYNIEINSFDEGIYECISEAESITQEEIDYLTSGELISAELYDISEDKNENITPTSEEDKGYVEEYLSGMFIDMLKDNIIPESQEDLRYSVVLMYKDNDKTIRRTYYVHENGCVVLYEYEVTPAGEEPITTASYSVDFNDFELCLGKFGVNIEK